MKIFSLKFTDWLPYATFYSNLRTWIPWKYKKHFCPLKTKNLYKLFRKSGIKIEELRFSNCWKKLNKLKRRLGRNSFMIFWKLVIEYEFSILFLKNKNNTTIYYLYFIYIHYYYSSSFLILIIFNIFMNLMVL